MASSQREALPKFDVKGDPSTVAQRWKRWKRGFELYVKAQTVTYDAKQKALLLHCGRMDLQDVFYALEAEGDADTYAQCVTTLDAHFLPQKNIAFERHLFRQLEQGATETVDQYVCRLREKASTCEFSNIDASIHDQLINKRRVGNVPLDIIVDSGATVNVIGQNTWEYLKENKIDCVARKCSDSKIYPYGFPEPLPVIGSFETLVKAGTCEASCQFSVIKRGISVIVWIIRTTRTVENRI